MPLALTIACIGVVIGLIIGVFYALSFSAISSMIPSTAQAGVDLTFLRVTLGVGALIIMPVIGFAGVLIQGLFYAFLYNVIAPRIGGIRLRFKEGNKPPR
jgi:hypothetical protein